MRKISTFLIFLIFSIASIPQAAVAKSSVWKATKNGNTVYLAGTLHLLTEQDYPLPDEFDVAFDAAQTIVFETDMAAIMDPAFQQKMLLAMALPPGEPRLKQQLTTETWQALESKLASRGIPLAQFNDFRISMVLLTLTIAEYQALGFTAPGVDANYHQIAVTRNKAIDSLETPDEQIEFLVRMGDEDAETLVQYTLEDIKTMPEYVAKLKSTWRNGDLAAFTEVGITSMKQDYPQVYQILIKSRNDKWLEQINNYIKTAETESLFVGALHMAGPDGLVARLKEQGYKVQQLN